MDQMRSLGRKYLSRSMRRRLARLATWPPVGWVWFGHLRRTKPVTGDYGISRGLSIDRYYIDAFLASHAQDIHGRVLEIKDNAYTRKYGQERVTQSDVLNKTPDNPDATIIADLANADHLPSNMFDAIILTQTLQFIYDLESGVRTLCRILKPGGVLLVTAPGIAQICSEDDELYGDCWRFTTRSARLLFEAVFPGDLVTVQSYGSVLSAVAFLEGLACEDLSNKELEANDPKYQFLIAVRAVKPA